MALFIPLLAIIFNLWPTSNSEHIKTQHMPEESTSNYILLSAAEKAERLWSNCIENTESATWPNAKTKFESLMFNSMCPTFLTPGDAMPPGRIKFIHSVGVVGRVEWRDIGGHPYTGVFKGAKHGIARLSHAQYADNSSRTLPAPGMGLKFLRSGHDSANLLAMFSVAGQEKLRWKNMVSPATFGVEVWLLRDLCQGGPHGL